jgi:uncharacterized protein (TIGR00730 family)
MTGKNELINRPVISVFGSHAPAPGSADYENARDVGRLLAEAGYGVATGGYGGVMSAASQGAAEAGGQVIGVTSAQVESTRGVVINRWVQVSVPFDSLTDRLIYLVRNNDGMVVMPGGIGTLSEFALAWSFMQVGEMCVRPLVLMGPMWSDTLTAFARDEYGAPSFLDMLYVADSADDAVDYIQRFRR